MIGYMKPLKGRFTKEQEQVYQSVYCGLCRAIKYEYGFAGTAALNFELSDLLLLLSSAAEEEPETMRMSCSLSPLLWRRMQGIGENLFSLAAGISVLIASLELRDNVIDDGKMKDQLLYSLAGHKAGKMFRRHSRAYVQITEAYEEYMDREQEAKEARRGFEDVLAACGRITGIIGEILAEEAVPGCAALSGRIMYLWGQWVYLMDAVEDYAGDKKKNSFNPLFLEDRPEDVEKLLSDLEREAGNLIMQMPLKRNRDAIENLYLSQLPERRRQTCLEMKGKVPGVCKIAEYF